MPENTFLARILHGLVQAKDGKVIFSASEIGCWPEGYFDVFKKAGFLRRCKPANSIECPGCEEFCFMPVDVVPASPHSPARSFITCDKRDNMGRIPIEADLLEQWQITEQVFVNTVSQLLGIKDVPHHDKDRYWRLGVLKDQARVGQITLHFNNQVSLSVCGQDIPLIEIIIFENTQFKLDVDGLSTMINQLEKTSRKNYRPSVIRREARKLDTQHQHIVWGKAYRELKHKNPYKSDTWCSQQIARMDIAKGCTATTIRRYMKKS